MWCSKRSFFLGGYFDSWANNGLKTRQPVAPDERAAMDRCETDTNGRTIWSAERSRIADDNAR